MGELTLLEYSYNFLIFEFECPPIGSRYIYVNYWSDVKDYPAIEKEVEPGVDIHIKFDITGLDPNTLYYVQILDSSENVISDIVKATTSTSPYLPKIKNFSAKRSGAVISYSFVIENLNEWDDSGVYWEDSDVKILIDGETVAQWDGEDVNSEITLSSSGDIECSDSETHTFRLEAYNIRFKSTTGDNEYGREETLIYREIILKSALTPFEWSIVKVTGEPIRVSASEWNDFTDRINEILNYKGENAVAFTTAVSAGFTGRNVGTAFDGLTIDSPKVISKSILCEAVDALNTVLPADEKISYPAGISADFFNKIVDKLNSIS